MFEQDKKDSHSSQNICHTLQYPQTVSLDLQGIKVLKAVYWDDAQNRMVFPF